MTCLYCEKQLPLNEEGDYEGPPSPEDDKAWELLALQHNEDCEYIRSRAFQSKEEV